MTESRETKKRPVDDGADVEDVERGTEDEKGSMAEEVERAQAREEQAGEG